MKELVFGGLSLALVYPSDPSLVVNCEIHFVTLIATKNQIKIPKNAMVNRKAF